MSSFDASSRTLSAFERHVLELMLEGDSPEARILQSQAAIAEVSQRSEPGGSGAWIWLDVPDHASRLCPPIMMQIANLQGVIHDGACELAAMFNLHLDAGALSVLEIIAPNGPWPERPTLRSWTYLSRGRRGLIIPDGSARRK